MIQFQNFMAGFLNKREPVCLQWPVPCVSGQNVQAEAALCRLGPVSCHTA